MAFPQLLILVMAIGLLAHNQLGSPVDRLTSMSVWLGLWLGIPLAMGLLYAMACRWTFKRLGTERGAASLHRLDGISSLYRWGILGLYLANLGLGSLTHLREAVTAGDRLLVDELIFVLPWVGLLWWGWWVYYPIDRRLRQATVLRRLDQGLAVQDVWTRGQYMLNHVRHQMALLGLPLLLLLAWHEVIDHLLKPWTLARWGTDSSVAWMLGGTLTVFLLTPVLMRYVWDTSPLPPGPLREDLENLCRVHGVRVREILLWRTYGTTINAAVMGILKPVRFILLTDALLDQMPQRQVQAVMAHEIAHVRRHHMFWLLLSAMAALEIFRWFWLGFFTLVLSLDAVQEQINRLPVWVPEWLNHPTFQLVFYGLLILLGWVVLFGWVSRRYERQADSFAAGHMSRYACASAGPITVVEPQAAQDMIDALQTVADLNHLPTEPRGWWRKLLAWRHGTIRWRQDYLAQLPGQPLDALPIDRQVRFINTASLAVLILSTLGEIIYTKLLSS